MSVLSQGGENIEVNKATGTWDSTITEALLTFRSLLAMYSKKYHDFSLVKKYGISVYTLRPYRNPFQKNEFGKFVLFFQKP